MGTWWVYKEVIHNRVKKNKDTGEFEVKGLEGYQPRGIAKLLFYLLCFGMFIDCACMITGDNDIFERIVFILFLK